MLYLFYKQSGGCVLLPTALCSLSTSASAVGGTFLCLVAGAAFATTGRLSSSHLCRHHGVYGRWRPALGTSTSLLCGCSTSAISDTLYMPRRNEVSFQRWRRHSLGCAAVTCLGGFCYLRFALGAWRAGGRPSRDRHQNDETRRTVCPHGTTLVDERLPGWTTFAGAC